jgi:hypothetical protein
MIKEFNYWLTGTGWAEAFFSSNNQNIRFELSYLSDPLFELFEGLNRLINNQSDIEEIVFAEEPGEHSLIISKQNKEIIKVEIFWSDEWEAIGNRYKTVSKKELIFADTETLWNFSTAICVGMDNFLERQTFAEYKEKWLSFEFPIKSYDNFRKAIKLI